MSRTARTALFLASAGGLGFLVVWALTGLPPFGHYPGPYGDIVTHVVQSQRHMANAVTAVVFDYRGFDTMGEELLLFAAASAAALLLRETRESQTSDIVDAVRSDASRGVGAAAVAVVFVLGLNVVAHGFITPGGGFQGGVVLAASFALVFLAVEYHAYHRLVPTSLAEPIEAFGAGAYVGLGLISFGFGLAFLQNFMELGVFGRLSSGGSAILVNWSSALAVAGGFLVLFGEYLKEDMAARYGRARVR
ncbi:MAG TPA: MnhB domain-containing protein [Gaiellaceae bacterium]|nr:MnhB domain-containing protein [Gaiellaceae bacterium]